MNTGSFGQAISKGVTKFSNSVIVKTIASGMARLLPVTITGSIITLILNIPITAWTDFLQSSGLYGIIAVGSTMTNDIITLYLLAVLAYEMSQHLKVSVINAIIVTIISFFIVTPMLEVEVAEKTMRVFTTTYLGSRGMFVGIIVALTATALYSLFIKKGPKIKLPDAVPPAISSSFESLFPAIGVVAIFIAVRALFLVSPWGDIHSAVYKFLQAPLEGLSGSIWTMVFLALLGEFFWFFGIHGSNVTGAANQTLFMPAAIENASNINKGIAATNVVNSYFLEAFKGPRHFVLAAMLNFMSKSEQLKAVGKISIVPGIFGISEPMKFGIPMVFNPIILVPMSLAPVVSLLIAYFATSIGFVSIISVAIPWTVPPIISGFLAAGWQGVVVQLIQMVAIFLLYLPFFKVLDNSKLKEEAEAAKLEAGEEA